MIPAMKTEEKFGETPPFPHSSCSAAHETGSTTSAKMRVRNITRSTQTVPSTYSAVHPTRNSGATRGACRIALESGAAATPLTPTPGARLPTTTIFSDVETAAIRFAVPEAKSSATGLRVQKHEQTAAPDIPTRWAATVTPVGPHGRQWPARAATPCHRRAVSAAVCTVCDSLSTDRHCHRQTDTQQIRNGRVSGSQPILEFDERMDGL